MRRRSRERAEDLVMAGAGQPSAARAFRVLSTLARYRSAAGAVAGLAAGRPAVLLTVPGWLDTGALRKKTLNRISAAGQDWQPVHARWVWLRERADGSTETAFLMWPCRTGHPPYMQCHDGRVFHANHGISRSS